MVYTFLSFGNYSVGLLDYINCSWLQFAMEVKEIWVEGPTLPVMQRYKCCGNDGDNSTEQIWLLHDSFQTVRNGGHLTDEQPG